MADAGKDPVPEFKKSIKISKNIKTRILWASTREPYNYVQAKQLGCHIITVPPSIIEKLKSLEKVFKNLQLILSKVLIDTKKSKFKFKLVAGDGFELPTSSYEPCELPGCSTPRLENDVYIKKK